MLDCASLRGSLSSNRACTQPGLGCFNRLISFSNHSSSFDCMRSHTTCSRFSSNTLPSNPPKTDIVLPVHGRNKPIALGQVGLRCQHCKDRLHNKHAVTYPTYISSIYNSVKQMFRLHFDHCDMIPAELKNKVGTLKDSTANRGGRKQYWVDSAKRLGLVDTSFGIHFGRNPCDPLPPLGGPRDRQAHSLEEDESSQPSLTEDGSPLKIDFYGSQDVQEPEYYPLVLPEDKPLISDYLYLALEQMQPANLMDADRVGCYKGRRTGFPGLACKHCVGQAGCGRYFPASEASLSQTTTSQTLVNHVRNCRRCPIEVREELELMKRAKGNFETKVRPQWRMLVHGQITSSLTFVFSLGHATEP